MTERFRKTRLRNGLRVVSEKMDGVRSVSIGVWIASGSRHETMRLSGISHFLEHMLFKGTRSRTAYRIATSLESLGGHLNAFTEREFTCAYAVILDENLPDAVDVLADVVQHPRLDPRDIQNEKHIVSEEIKNLEDAPEDFVQEFFLRSIFPDHPLGLSTLGTDDSLDRIRLSDLKKHHRRHYTCGNTIISAAGNLEHEKLVRMVERRFRDLPSGRLTHPLPARFGAKRLHKTVRPTTQTHLVTGVPAYAYNNPKKFSLIILDVYFGGGMSSRLFQNLREKQGLAYTVYSFIDFWSDAGLWGVYTGTSPERLEQAVVGIDREFRRVLERGIPDNALKRVQNQLTRNLVLSLEDPSSRMNRIAKMEAYSGEYIPIREVVRSIQNVRPLDVQNTAAELLNGQERFTVTVEPESD
ncbi:MAG TPA: pitrilysin family protein [bacterium]